MNRIYQGRVTGLRIQGQDATWQDFGFGDASTCLLWSHHRIFQDAVNYYLVALGALANAGASSGNRLVEDLGARLAESWNQFPRDTSTPARSLRDSLKAWLDLTDDASLADAFAETLDDNDATPEALTLALELLLAKCNGDGAIQQGGRSYFPRFCVASVKATYDVSSASTSATQGLAELSAVLHGAPTQADLERIARMMDLSWTVKVQPGKYYEGHEAKARLRQSLDHLRQMVLNPLPRLAEALASIDQPLQQIDSFIAELDELRAEFRIPRNRKPPSLDRLFSSIAFIHFPCVLTATCLRQGIAAPEKLRRLNEKMAAADFGRLGDDPIKLARGSRGFVFRAFSALTAWNPPAPGEPVWKEFDIAAFKEALKALNQFKQKTDERVARCSELEAQLDWMLAKTPPRSPGSSAEESERLPRLEGDPRFKLARDLEHDMTEQLMLDPATPFKISRASLRGFRDLTEEWNALIKKNAAAPAEELQAVVKRYQADPKNQREIGSVALMLALCEPRYRELWVAPDDDTAARLERDSRPANMLAAMVRLHDLESELIRSRAPIRLTPAEPEHSRRLFMFSDLNGRSSSNFVAEDTVEVSIVHAENDSLREARIQLRFSAPRLKRDELTGGAESRWLQPMTAALGIGEGPSRASFDSAVALMPNRMADGTIRHLLNFPVALVPDWIHQVLGKSERWSHQFNGTKEQRIHLHWPSTAKKATSDSPWWSDPAVVQEGFTVLANDIGQRNAGAWALLKVAPEKPETSRPVRPIGYDGAREWFAEVIRTGMYRLPGEEARVLVKGQFQREPSGKRGRRASPDEYQDAVALAVWLGTPNPESWITRDQSFAEQNDQLIKLANRRLTRLNTYHRWSCFDSQSDRSAAIASRLVDELAAFDDPEVKPWLTLVEKGDFASFTATVGHAFLKLRRDLERILVTLANRTAPLRRATWTWRPRTEGSAYGMLVRTESAARSPKIRGQRGLSMSRLEQLESLRRLFLRFNRALDREPGKRASFGFDDRGRESGEPCLELLEKITRMKEQRVNQTAHLILAQALGVRLKRHVLPESRRTACDIHGEYEKIPGREPVDFIVIEDLSRYLSNQGRSPSENSRLMRWAHRAVRDKLKMLAEEPFGIPVVEVVPAYSSRFYAITGQPGARLREAHELQVYEIQRLEKLAERKEHTERRRATAAREILNQFEKVAQLNQRRRSIGATLHTLYLPMTGGPLFLAARDGGPVQADTNASINLGWRAIAAPECIDIHRRVRAKKEKGTFRARLDNAREKAAFSSNPVIELRGGASKKLEASSSPNFFFEPDRLGWPDTDAFDRATLAGHQLVSGVALWWWVNQAIYSRCADLNRQRLAQWENDDDLPF